MIETAELTQYASVIEGSLKPSVRLTLTPEDESRFPLGASKFGGRPDLPDGIAWPVCAPLPLPSRQVHSEYEYLGGPLSFLLQVSLPDIAESDPENTLPHTGIFYFFAAMSRNAAADTLERDCWHALYWDGDPSHLKRRDAPSIPVDAHAAALGFTEPPEFTPLTSCAIAFARSLTAPLRSDIGMSDDEMERYGDAFWDVAHGDDDHPRHQLLGYEGFVQDEQGDMGFSAELCFPHEVFPYKTMTREAWSKWDAFKETQRRWAKQWRLLIQLDTQPDLDITWPAWGRGFFWIAEDALAARDFSQIYFINQHT